MDALPRVRTTEAGACLTSARCERGTVRSCSTSRTVAARAAPMCFTERELALGPGDRLLGRLDGAPDGVPVYASEAQCDYLAGLAMTLTSPRRQRQLRAGRRLGAAFRGALPLVDRRGGGAARADRAGLGGACGALGRGAREATRHESDPRQHRIHCRDQRAGLCSHVVHRSPQDLCRQGRGIVCKRMQALALTMMTGHSAVGTLCATSSTASGMVSRVARASSRSLWITTT